MLRQTAAAARRLDRLSRATPPDAFWDEVESNLLTALILVCAREEPGLAVSGSSARIRRAIDYARAHAHGPVTLADLVTVTGLPGRTLFRHFRAATGSSPSAYLRRVRLAALRDELAAGACESVASAARRRGFHDLGRLAAMYRREFGENPSATLRHAR
jgi:transcriptional regulator GlxA family with amidase domain